MVATSKELKFCLISIFTVKCQTIILVRKKGWDADGIFTSLVLFNCSTFQMNCPAFDKLRSSGDGTKLVATEISEEHNHQMNKVQYVHK